VPSLATSRRLGRAEVLRLLDDAGVVPSKALGQHFVVDPNTVERVVRLAGVGPGEHVLEVGPGLGSLTLALAGTGAAVTAVEIDERLVALARRVLPDSVRLVHADALAIDWGPLVADAGAAGCSLVANLPYGVATPLVLGLLERTPAVRRMLVMVQREVAERLAAPPGGRGCGAPSVRVAYFARARVVGRVGPDVFFPRPRVESALLEVERRAAPAVDPALASYEEIAALVRAGFAGRRKMLRRSLAGIVAPEAFGAAGVDPTARAEELDVAAWGKLAACARSATSSPTPS